MFAVLILVLVMFCMLYIVIEILYLMAFIVVFYRPKPIISAESLMKFCNSLMPNK